MIPQDILPLKGFYMIRHGETEANAARIMAGSLDSPLNQNGRDQARAVQTIMRALPVKPTVIIHSHLSRARETAEIINEALKLPLYEDPDLAELHAGDWEGVSYDQCHSLLDGWDDPPGGERYEDFFARIKRAKKKALETYEGRVLIVSHGGVFRGFAKLYGMDIWGVRNCALHEFSPREQKQQPETFPWMAHIYEYQTKLLKRLSDSFHTEKPAEEKIAS